MNHYVPLWGDRMLQLVLPETQCLSYDWTQDNVRSQFSLSGTLLELTGLWHPASGHSALSVRSQPDNFTLIKWTDRTLRQRLVTPKPASGQYLTIHSLPTHNHMWMKFAPIDLRAF